MNRETLAYSIWFASVLAIYYWQPKMVAHSKKVYFEASNFLPMRDMFNVILTPFHGWCVGPPKKF